MSRHASPASNQNQQPQACQPKLIRFMTVHVYLVEVVRESKGFKSNLLDYSSPCSSSTPGTSSRIMERHLQHYKPHTTSPTLTIVLNSLFFFFNICSKGQSGYNNLEIKFPSVSNQSLHVWLLLWLWLGLLEDCGGNSSSSSK